MKMTTLCYIEKDNNYLMYIEPRKKMISIRVSGLVLEVTQRAVRHQRNVF